MQRPLLGKPARTIARLQAKSDAPRQQVAVKAAFAPRLHAQRSFGAQMFACSARERERITFAAHEQLGSPNCKAPEDWKAVLRISWSEGLNSLIVPIATHIVSLG